VACVRLFDGMTTLLQNVRFLQIKKYAPPPPQLSCGNTFLRNNINRTRLHGVTSHTTAFTLLSFHFYSHHRTMFSMKEDFSVRHGLQFGQEAGLSFAPLNKI